MSEEVVGTGTANDAVAEIVEGDSSENAAAETHATNLRETRVEVERLERKLEKEEAQLKAAEEALADARIRLADLEKGV